MPIPTPEHYVMYGSSRSYFSRKLEAALAFLGLKFEFLGRTPSVHTELHLRAGTHQIPVLHTPDNWMIADTTPLIDLLDARYPARRLFPQGPLGVLVHVLEEWFDEWIARTAVHYRWNHADSTEEAAPLMAAEAAGGDPALATSIERMLRDWGPRACRATGVSSPVQQRAAEAEYERILEALEAQLSVTRYALGDRPSAVDAVILGGLRAHFLVDVVPKRVVARYPRVLEWSSGKTLWDGTGELAALPESTPFARFVLGEMRGPYRAFVLGNARARAEGQKAFVSHVYAEDVSYLSRAYPEESRRMIHARIEDRLGTAERAEVRRFLEQAGLTECFMP